MMDFYMKFGNLCGGQVGKKLRVVKHASSDLTETLRNFFHSLIF